MKSKFWIVGKNINCRTCQEGWRFVGVFASEALALNVCQNDLYFIAPVPELNTELPDAPWDGAYYPLADTMQGASLRFESFMKQAQQNEN